MGRHRDRRGTRAKPTGTRIWTVQPLEVWEQLQREGRVLVDEARMEYVPEGYRWLTAQLAQRLRDYPGTLPWWAYCKKPRLGWLRPSRPPGEHVRIELEPVPGTFLTWPIWAWDAVYGGMYLSFGRREAVAWKRAMRRVVRDEDLWPLPEPWRSELEASWLRLFHPALPTRAWGRDACVMHRAGSREAALGVLKLEEVRGVRCFIGTSKTWRSGHVQPEALGPTP